MGPELMADLPRAGRPVRHRATSPPRCPGSTCRRARSGCGSGTRTPPSPTYTAEALIVATGAKSLMLELPNEERLLGYGVSTCATCDGFFFRGHEIAVVGGGDSALEEALFLTRFADKVTLIHRRGELRASKVMQQRAFTNPKIEFLWHTAVIDVLGDTKVRVVRVRNTETGEESDARASPACSWPSATSPTPRSSRASSTWRTAATCGPWAPPRHQRRRGVRLRRRPGPPLPPGHHRRRLGLHGGHRRRALARGPGGLAPLTAGRTDRSTERGNENGAVGG